MELKQLHYFIAVAEELSFTKAAQRLFISQPPLSRQIQQLEAEVGTLLITRKTRSIELTPAGDFFYQHAKTILQQAEEAKLMAKRIGTSNHEFKVGFVGSVLYGYLPKIIHRLRQRQPNFKIVMEEMRTPEQIHALKEGKIDVGFGRVFLEDSLIKTVVLRGEDLVVATPQHHPKLNQQTSIKLADLVDEHIILSCVNRAPSYSGLIIDAFKQRQLPIPHMREVRDLQFALGLVAAGEGISIVPSSYEKIRFDVIYQPLNDFNLTSPINMHFRKGEKSQIMVDLLQIIYQIYDEENIPYIPDSQALLP